MSMYPPPFDNARPITLLIADDHPLILAGLAALIRAEPGLQLAGEATDAPTAVAQYMRLRPEIVYLVGLHFLDHADQIRCVREIAIVQLKADMTFMWILIKVIDSLRV